MRGCFVGLVMAGALLAAGVSRSEPPGFAPPSHGFLPRAPKIFGRFEEAEPATGKLTLAREKDGKTLTFPTRPDLDVFVHAGFGWTGELHPGDRVWAVFDPVETKQGFNAVWFLADELGLQTIHDDWFSVGAVDPVANSVALVDARGVRRTLPVAAGLVVRYDGETGGAALLRPGGRIRYQTRFEAGQYRVTEILDAMALTRHTSAQRGEMVARLTREGVPGELLAASAGSEAKLLLYRPGGDWTRNLSPGDAIRVAVAGSPPSPARVTRVEPWGEKTRMSIAFTAAAPAVTGHSPCRAFVPHLDPGTWELPPGLGRAKNRGERLDWLLSTIYCTCGLGPDGCTGQLFTLSMCEPKSCSMPDGMRGRMGRWIDQGRSDAEILRMMEQEAGPQVRRPHLVGKAP